MRTDRNPASEHFPLKERRRSNRLPTPTLQVAIERPDTSGLWITDALDLSGDGLGVVLPADFAPGMEVLLTFQLEESVPFLRVPAVVLRQELGIGAVRFAGWPPGERHRLSSYLGRQAPNETRH